MNEVDRKELNIALNMINHLIERLDYTFPTCKFGELRLAMMAELTRIQAQRAADESSRD